MPDKAERRIYKAYLLSVSLAVALFITAIFLGISIRTRGLIMQEFLSHARAHFKGILMARQWNASYGGVYVEKKPGTDSSPFLPHPDMKAADGRTFTLKAPAIMTKEISLLSSQKEGFAFHITSLNPLNPANAPDEFEAYALKHFGRGQAEVFDITSSGGRTYYRYMAPLMVEESCLPCHRQQGYKVGDVRGGISVTLDITKATSRIKTDTAIVIALAFCTIVLLVITLWYYTGRLMSQLTTARKALEERAITDDLTGLSNRRHSIERLAEEMQRARRGSKHTGLIMFDIDRFKTINDTHGHQRGDQVLKEVAERLRASLRPYDIFGRIGGEEFLVVLPDTDTAGLRELASRLHDALRCSPVQGLAVTASFGITAIKESDTSIDDALRRADVALYRAKNMGRDRIEEEL